jgi:tyrosyl-tRNA synthetase
MSGVLLDTLRERGLIAQVSDEDGLRRAMEQGPITLYQGFDPTATSLHTGNLVGIMALAHFQRAGHRPIVVVGGGTGLIGDPSDRESERPMLSVADIQRNLAGIRMQFSRYLDFGDGSDERALIIDNADWLLGLKWIEFLRDVGRHFTVNQLMQHGTYRERFETGSFSFIELNYALVQAYDFLHLYRELGCILQVGGNDQWFNILAGRDLIRRSEGGEAFALTTPLVTTTSGEKLGKTAGNAVWLDPRLTSPYEYYQYWRNTEDADVGRFLRMFTFLPLEEIAELERLTGADLNRAK